MAQPIPYDPTATALFHPERQPPLPMDESWSGDAVAAEFSRLAYVRFENGEAERQAVAEAVAKAGYGDFGYFAAPPPPEAPAAQGFAARNGAGHAIIAFRGTQPDSLQDLLTNADALLVSWSGAGKVHRGFWRALSSLLPQVDAWRESHAAASTIVTGHSLGAAIATLLAARSDAAALVTFGSPRIGNEAFADSLDAERARRYVDCTDMVTDVPPPILYAHVGEAAYIDAKGRVHEPGSMGLPARALDQLRANADYLPLATRRGNVPLRALADHAPVNYVSAILGRRTGP